MLNRDYDFIFWGASGRSLVLYDIVKTQGRRVVALFDNNREQESLLDGVPVFYGLDGYNYWVDNKTIGRIAATSAI
jgi:hypothetical protein